MTTLPEWNVAIVDGEPQVVISMAALEELIRASPLGETEARRRLTERGVPINQNGDPS